MDNEKNISSIIGVKAILSNNIGVEKHNYYYVLYGLAGVFIACWLMAFCDLIGISI